MKIVGNTIYFKTNPVVFEKEKSGIKPNTVRFLPPSEEALLDKSPQITHITIVNYDTGESFTRELQDITCFTYNWFTFKKIFVFSWSHPSKVPTADVIASAVVSNIFRRLIP